MRKVAGDGAQPVGPAVIHAQPGVVVLHIPETVPCRVYLPVLVVEIVADLRRLTLAAALPEDWLEHVYVQPAPGGAALAFFILAPSLLVAEAAGERLCQRLLDISLAGSVLQHCEVALIAPLAEASLAETGEGKGSGQASPATLPDQIF
jgi:hypothetical protein